MHKRLNMIHQKISKLLPLIGVGEYYIVDTLSIRTTKAGAPLSYMALPMPIPCKGLVPW